MAAKKSRIDTNPLQSGLNQAFTGLSISGLPAGPEKVEPEATKAQRPAKLGRVVLRKETAHRGGKTVIVAHDFAPQVTDDLIDELASKLRNACGTGGTVRDRTIEIQGNQPQKIREVLEAEGFRVAGV
jgi:translation initiation factor 1